MLSVELRDLLSNYHSEIEKYAFSVNILSGSLQYNQYKLLLIKQYLAHKLLEEQINHFKNELKTLGYDYHEKLSSLKTDLKNIDVSIENITTNGFKISLENTSDVLGTLYVIEGSTLGGNLIAQYLPNCPELKGIKKSSYYNIYGAETKERFNQFCEILNSYSEKNNAANEIKSAAIKTYEFMISIFKNYKY